MTVSPNPVVVGQSFTVTATVIPLGVGTPTGTVNISIPGATPSSANPSLVGGTASATFTATSAGVLTVTAAYSGDANFTGSTGFNAVAVIQGTTTTLVVSAPDPSNLGQNVAITATVTPVAPAMGTPTGTVTFVVTGSGGGTFTQPVSGNQATINLSSLGVGSHAITAIYSGDTNFLPSAGSDTQTVNAGPAATTTTLSSSANPSVFGQNVTFTATVTTNPPATGTPTGTVVFTIDGNPTGPVTLVSGQATFSTSTLAVGTHTVSAAYTSNAPSTFANSSTTTPLTQTVSQAATTTTGTAHQSAAGQPVSFIAFVQPVPPGSGTRTGPVNFVLTQGVTTVFSGSANVDANGFAFLTDGTQPAGSYTLTSTYAGDTNFSGSSDTRTVTIA
ncbi:Ig-like domain-containing protein [Streptomyces sp. NPDC020845]|uniref:Ig-like domain-containing protein n=1 Tax=Streptomyces sp. NPDC020845 TaxID=3365096 RepID=UPI0037A8036D